MLNPPFVQKSCSSIPPGLLIPKKGYLQDLGINRATSWANGYFLSACIWASEGDIFSDICDKEFIANAGVLMWMPEGLKMVNLPGSGLISWFNQFFKIFLAFKPFQKLNDFRLNPARKRAMGIFF